MKQEFLLAGKTINDEGVVEIRGRDGTERAGEDDGETRSREMATCPIRGILPYWACVTTDRDLAVTRMTTCVSDFNTPP